MERKQVQYGVICKHNNPTSQHHSNSLYIIASTDGLVKINGDWKQCIEYYCITDEEHNKPGKYFRSIEDFCSKFDYVTKYSKLGAQNEIKRLQRQLSISLKPKTTFKWLIEYINTAFENSQYLYRAEILDKYRADYYTDYIPATIDTYRRMLTVTGYLTSDGGCPGIYKILQNIPMELTLSKLKFKYSESLKSNI